MAFSIGIHIDEFKKMTPKQLELCVQGYNMRQIREDHNMWTWFGNYATSAVYVAIDTFIHGRKATSKFIEKAVMSLEEEREPKYKESNEEVAVYEMKQRIRILRESGLPESPD